MFMLNQDMLAGGKRELGRCSARRQSRMATNEIEPAGTSQHGTEEVEDSRLRRAVHRARGDRHSLASVDLPSAVRPTSPSEISGDAGRTSHSQDV